MAEGAGNDALNVAAIGGQAVLILPVGGDAAGGAVRALVGVAPGIARRPIVDAGAAAGGRPGRSPPRPARRGPPPTSPPSWQPGASAACRVLLGTRRRAICPPRRAKLSLVPGRATPSSPPGPPPLRRGPICPMP